VEVGKTHGLKAVGVINCDNIITVAKAVLDDRPVGKLDSLTRIKLDRALRYALDIVF
jgi:mRNA-degrading endonuclease toxin of MazEF toxin-antitoxin module